MSAKLRKVGLKTKKPPHFFLIYVANYHILDIFDYICTVKKEM
jgi:hypothetical protein